MRYIVMECQLSYAVVLDENGRFLKVANRHYEVGQTVTDIIKMQTPQAALQKKNRTWIYSLVAMAACLALVVTALLQTGQSAYASVYLTINPEVRIDVDKQDRVIGLAGVNADGNELIKNYSFEGKILEAVADELLDKAIAMGYLSEGGQITLTFDAGSQEWISGHSDSLSLHLNEYLSSKISITIIIKDKSASGAPTNAPSEANDPAESNYGNSDYNEVAPAPENSESEQNDSDDETDDDSKSNTYSNEESNRLPENQDDSDDSDAASDEDDEASTNSDDDADSPVNPVPTGSSADQAQSDYASEAPAVEAQSSSATPTEADSDANNNNDTNDSASDNGQSSYEAASSEDDSDDED